MVATAQCIEEVIMYRTRDGELHRSREIAEIHTEHLDSLHRANEMLQSGATVAEAARAAGFNVPSGSVLERITAETPLRIPHYQCRDEPGYKVCRINPDLSIFVYGDAGSWSGPTGYNERISDVERYARETLRYMETLDS